MCRRIAAAKRVREALDRGHLAELFVQAKGRPLAAMRALAW